MTGAQKAYLRGLAQNLKPLLHIGKNGLTDAAGKELDALLAHHELVKVKFDTAGREERKSLSADLAQKTGSTLIGAVGRTAVYYLPNPDPAKRTIRV